MAIFSGRIEDAHYINEKYDTIEDPTLRLKEIFNLIDEIGKMNLSQLEQMHLEMKGILEFNLANLNKLQ